MKRFNVEETEMVATIDHKIVQYKEWMLNEIIQLFYESVHTICIKHYSKEQLNRWAPLQADLRRWQHRLEKNICYVAMYNNTITGFTELTNDGHVETLYVHKNFQQQGIARALMGQVLKVALMRNYTELTTEASITAKPFFENAGFKVERVKTTLHNKKAFLNYEMTKEL